MRLMHAAVGATICSVLGVSSPAEAAVVTYTYVGLPLHATETGGWWDDTIDGYSGQMVIDEAALGHSLKNAVVSFHWFSFLPVVEPPPEGLVAFDIFPTEMDFFDWIINFKTNEFRQIIDWYGYFLHGPPDGGSTTGFDFWYNASISDPPAISDELFPAGSANYFSEGPGTWTVEVSPVPIPGALALFLTGIAGLGLFSWVRRRIAEPCMSG